MAFQSRFFSEETERSKTSSDRRKGNPFVRSKRWPLQPQISIKRKVRGRLLSWSLPWHDARSHISRCFIWMGNALNLIVAFFYLTSGRACHIVNKPYVTYRHIKAILFIYLQTDRVILAQNLYGLFMHCRELCDRLSNKYCKFLFSYKFRIFFKFLHQNLFWEVKEHEVWAFLIHCFDTKLITLASINNVFASLWILHIFHIFCE